MDLYLISRKVIGWLLKPDTITSIGVVSSLIFSIITLRNSKRAQIEQQQEIENNRFEEQRGILQVYTVTNDISSNSSIDCMVVKNIGKSPLKIINFKPNDEFMRIEKENWKISILSKTNIWIPPGQTHKYICNLDEHINGKKNDLEFFSVYYEYETLGKKFKETINGLTYKYGEPFKLYNKSKNTEQTLEEIKYQLYIMNTK
ncbi:hypothetical protein J0A94_03875 [Paraclostridium bifermentans]|uniref:Uncharacterized protein n=1 Tax=Paraclostridium bifermentans TaxID=1490 RepID=A0AA44DJJ7_PARBF|nr:hypothetical protein [Paraclostridium bifermentans]MBN8046955.1 hypothetical protein [Paraclostridium bifermentans]NME08973.1 hypothetical protein [Paraclostridium bifermentans]